MTITKKQATEAARKFVASITSPDRQWTVDDARSCMPAGTYLAEDVEAGDFHPVTVAHVAKVFHDNARSI